MRLLRRLYERFAVLVHEMAKFGTVGAAMFVLDWGCTNFLRYGLDLGPLISKVIATVIAATMSYMLNRYWTWRHRERSGLAREYTLFFALNGVGLLIALLVIGFVEYTLKLQDALAYNISIVVGNGLGTLFRFWSYKKWVFLPADLPPVDPHTGLPEADPDAQPGTQPKASAPLTAPAEAQAQGAGGDASG